MPTATGGRFSGGSTVTVNDCVALRPSGSVAVTVTADVPAATAARLTVLPETAATAATPGAEELA